MPEPIAEAPRPRNIEIGSTPVYLRQPIIVNGTEVREFILEPSDRRSVNGIGSAVLVTEGQRRAEPGQRDERRWTNVTRGDEVAWNEQVVGVQWTDEAGNPHTIARENISLDPLEPGAPAPLTQQTPAAPRAPSAREQLEARNLVIAGVKTRERRVFDLVNKSMERAKGWGRQAFKEVFEHKLTKYYTELLEISQSPFAEEAIRLAEEKGEAEYNNYYKSLNPIRKVARKIIEEFKAYALKTTWVQDATIRNLRDSQNQDIQAALARGKQMYLDEKGDFAIRFDSAFDRQDLAIRQEMGEKFNVLGPGDATGVQIRTLVKQYVHGDIDDAEFKRQKDALWTSIKSRDDLKDAEDYADTLTAVGKQYKEQWLRAGNDAEGQNRVNNEIDALRVALGTGQMGEATSMNKTDTQKAVGKIKEFSDFLVRKNIIGASLFNEATVGTAVSYALSVKSMGSMVVTSGARAVGGWVAGGAAAGVFGAAREKGRLTKEYWAYLGQREAGVQTTPGSKKREWFDAMDIKRRKSDEVVTALRANLYDANGALKTSLSDDEVRSTLGQLADAKARWALSSRKEKRVALIEIGGLGAQERNRTEFVRGIDKVEKDLGQYVTSHADIKARILGGQEYDAFLSGLTTTQTQILEKGKATFDSLQQDSAQRLALTQVAGYTPEVEKLRRRIFWLYGQKHAVGTASGLEATIKEFNTQANVEATRRGMATAAVGMGIGALTQEMIMDWKFAQTNGFQGVDTLGHGGVATWIKELTGWSDGNSPLVPQPEMVGDHFVQHSQNLHFDAQGNMDLVRPDGSVIQDNVIPAKELSWDPDGSFSQQTNDYLAGHGFANPTEVLQPAPADGTTDLWFGQDKVTVPNSLDWVDNGDGTSRLVLEVQDSSGNTFESIVHAKSILSQGGPNDLPAVIADIDKHPLLDFTPGHEIVTGTAPPDQIDLADLPTHHLADGTDHMLHATISEGSKLVETSHGIYRLVSEADPNRTMLADIRIDDTGYITNLNELNKSPLALANHLHLTNTDYNVTLPGEAGGGGGGTFDIRAGFLDNQTKYMGPNGPWGWGERVLGKGGPQDNLFKNAFRAWHNWDGNNNADIASAEVPGVLRTVPRVPEGFTMSDGTIGYQNSLNFNMGSDNLYIRNIPQSMFSDGNIKRIGQVMDGAIKEADTWKAAEIAAGHAPNVNDVLAHLKATDQLSYLAYKHGYIGQYFTEGDWDRFRELFEGPQGPSGLELHSPQIAQQLVEAGPPAIDIAGEVPNNLIIAPFTEPSQIPIPIIPALRRRGLEPGVPGAPGQVTVPTPEVPPPYYGYYWSEQGERSLGQVFGPIQRITLQENLPTEWDKLLSLLNNQSSPASWQTTGTYGYSTIQTPDTDILKESLNELQKYIKEADELVFAVGPRIGDGIMGMAYIHAIAQKIASQGLDKQFTIVTTKQLQQLFKPLEQSNIKFLASEDLGGFVNRGDNFRRASEYSAGASKAIIFDYESEGVPAMAEIKAQDKSLVIIRNLLPNAVMGYSNEKYGDSRFDQYANDIVGITSRGASRSRMELELPPNADTLYENLLRKYRIRRNQPQVSVLVESHEPGKRYSIDQWLDSVKEIQSQRKNMQINIVMNPSTPTPVKQQVEDSIRQHRIRNARIITEDSLLDLLILLKNQDAVLSTDTGMGIAASILRDGPPVVSLFLPGFPRHWKANNARQTVFEAPYDASNPDGGISCTDDAKKWINKISPQEIAQKTIAVLPP